MDDSRHNGGATDFNTEAMSITSAQHDENVQRFWSHEHTQSTLGKIKSLMASFVRRHGHGGKNSRKGKSKKSGELEDGDDPLREHNKSKMDIHPLDVEYGRLLRWLAAPDAWAVAAVFQWKKHSYRVTEEKVEALLLYIEAHEALLRQINGPLGGFPDIRIKLEQLVDDAKGVMMLALQASTPC